MHLIHVYSCCCACGKAALQGACVERAGGKAADAVTPEKREADAALGLQKLQAYIKTCGAQGLPGGMQNGKDQTLEGVPVTTEACEPQAARWAKDGPRAHTTPDLTADGITWRLRCT
jgi:hypothetical protein